MSVRDRVIQAAERLVHDKPYDQITFAEIAREAGVHWTAVRRHLGDKQVMRQWLQAIQSEYADRAFSDTRTKIMDAAAKMFAEHGYANTSLDKVASIADLTKGSVYWHFASKQDLFLAILERDLQQQREVLPVQIEQVLRAEDPEQALNEWLTAQFSCMDEGDAGAMLFFEFVTSSREPEVREKLQTLYSELLDDAAQILASLQQTGALASDLDPDSTAMIISALNKGILMEWLINPQRCKLETLIPTVSRVLWRGVSPAK